MMSIFFKYNQSSTCPPISLSLPFFLVPSLLIIGSQLCYRVGKKSRISGFTACFFLHLLRSKKCNLFTQESSPNQYIKTEVPCKKGLELRRFFFSVSSPVRRFFPPRFKFNFWIFLSRLFFLVNWR